MVDVNFLPLTPFPRRYHYAMDATETWASKLSASNRRSPRRRRRRLEGLTFGRLTVLSLHHGGAGGCWYTCRCECGNVTVTKGARLTKGNTRSCGCLKLESQRAQCAAMRQRQIDRARGIRPPCALAEALGYRTR